MATKRPYQLPAVNAFRSDDKIIVDSQTNGTGAMSKDDLLKITAENVVNSSVASGINVAELGHRHNIGTYDSITAGWYMKPDGSVERNYDYNLFMYDASLLVGKYVYSESNYLFSTSTSVSNRLTARVSGANLTPASAQYIIVCSENKPTIYELSFEESAKQEDSIYSLNTSEGAKNAILKTAVREKVFDYNASFPTSSLNDDGTAVIVSGKTLYRYDVQYIHGKTLLIDCDDGFVFSTSTATSDHIGGKSSFLKFSTIVPDNANSLFISASDDYNPVVTIITNSANAIIEDFVNGDLKLGDPIPSSDLNGYKIGPSGSATADSNYRITRCSVDGLAGKYIAIDFFGVGNYYCFSTSISASNKITNGLDSRFIKVPIGAKYVLVGSLKTLNPYVRVVNPVDKYGDYGIQFYWNEEKSYRLKESIDLNFGVNNDTGIATTDFDTKYPWCGMRVCNISFSNGKPLVVYYGDPTFSFANETFVEVPKFYFKREQIDERERWSISDKKGNGFELEPWFIDEDGCEVPVRYIARYPLSNLGISISGGIPSITNKNTAKTTIESAGFKLCNIWAYQAIIHLFLVETAKKNSQEFFSGVSYYRYYTADLNYQLNANGYTNSIKTARLSDRDTYFAIGDRVLIFPTASKDYGTAIIRNLNNFSYDENYCYFEFDGDPINLTQNVSRIFGTSQINGKTDSIVPNTGYLHNGAKETRPFTYRGIENLYGNLGEIIDGIIYDNNDLRFIVDGFPVNFKTDRNETYVEANTPKWVKTFGVDSRFPSLLLPSGSLVSSHASSYFDEWSTFGTGSDGSVSYGCAWDHINGNGIMTFRGLNANAGGNLYSFRAML